MQNQARRSRVWSRRSAVLLASGVMGALAEAACGRREDPAEQPAEEQTPEVPVVSDAMPAEPETQEPAAPASEFARMLQAGEVGSIRLIGDSITAGFLCDGYDADAITDTLIYDGPYGTFWETAYEVGCWANEFRAYVADKGVGSFVNAGICGAKMRWLAEDADAWIREAADVIFVMLGTNDAVYHTTDEYRAFAEEGLAAVEAACTHMVVLAPPDNAWTDYGKEMSQADVESVLREVCDAHGWYFVSLLDAVELHTDDLNEDQCHPTTKGSHALWERLRTSLGL